MRRSAADAGYALEPAFAAALNGVGFSSGNRAAIAVSGGGDSVALMHLAADWSKRHGVTSPVVLTVDHGLRAQSASDATKVANWAEDLGLKAAVLVWQGAKPRAGIEQHARNARYSLLGEWCIAHRIPYLLLGHTRDDQAETFLMRLARGSGIDGLASMPQQGPLPVPRYSSVELLRPLLEFSRDSLRNYLRQRGAAWLDDPMNHDPAFARVRVRQLLPAMAAAGLTPERIADASTHIARARSALQANTRSFLEQHVQFCDVAASAAPEALLDGGALRQLPSEIGLRVLSEILLRIGGAIYRPRFERLERLYRVILDGGLRGQTLAGCCVTPAPRSRQCYGMHTVLVRPELGRKTGRPASA